MSSLYFFAEAGAGESCTLKNKQKYVRSRLRQLLLTYSTDYQVGTYNKCLIIVFKNILLFQKLVTYRIKVCHFAFIHRLFSLLSELAFSWTFSAAESVLSSALLPRV